MSYHRELALYGPAAGSGDVNMLVFQFGGASGIGFPSIAQKRKGVEALKLRDGVLEDGLFVWIDEHGKRHKQDAYEAMYKTLNGTKVVYARRGTPHRS